MLNVDSAIEKIRRLVEPLSETEVIAATDSLGRVASKAVTTPIALPPFDCSAMDGYAIASNAGGSVTPKKYRIVGESAAGHPFASKLNPGDCTRIFTGAAVPAGTFSVVLQEDVQVNDDYIHFEDDVVAGENIRIAGLDIAKNATLIPTGTVVSPYALGWFAACGISELEVTRKVRVAVFSTGDELVSPGDELRYGQIYDSNRDSLKALLARSSIEMVDLGRLPDQYVAVKEALKHAASMCDIIVTSGGVSVGDADFVRPAVEAIGKLDFWNIALKPGKPLAVGRIDEAMFFGLPGNPVSTIVTYLLFVDPVLDRLARAPWRMPKKFKATLEGEIQHRRGRREFQRGFMRVESGELHVKPTGDQSSNRLATFHGCNCMIVVPENENNLANGATIEIMLLHNGAHLY